MLVYNTSPHSVRKDKKHLNKKKYSVALCTSGAELIHHKDGLVLKVPVIATDVQSQKKTFTTAFQSIRSKRCLNMRDVTDQLGLEPVLQLEP